MYFILNQLKPPVLTPVQPESKRGEPEYRVTFL